MTQEGPETQEEQNTSDIARNKETEETNFAALTEGGARRWEHIHASEAQIEQNRRGLIALTNRLFPRVKTLQWKLNVLAAFVIIMLLVIAFLLQRQAEHLKDDIYTQCVQRQTNSAKLANYYDRLIATEKKITSTSEETRQEHIRAFTDAKPIVPVCTRS